MALTQKLKSELSAVHIPQSSARAAEAIAMLRFGGGLHLVAGKIVVEAELDSAAAARRLSTVITDLWDCSSELVVINPSGIHRNPRYTIRVVADGERLARLTGLVDHKRRPVRGLPPKVVAGSVIDATAVWRGAFLARGSLTEPGRSMGLEVTCPGAEAALALVGAGRRLGITAKSRESRNQTRVQLRDGEAIAELLTRMGAQEVRLLWEERRMRREVRAQAHRLANFDDANLRRSVRAAVAASTRVQRALEILGDDVPEHLRVAGMLRIEHRQASLEELGKLHDPPLTKDAVAGRIRRLLSTADKAAKEQGIPDTEASLPPDLRDSD
ncbi:DNA-binding protein WhiA [uncultured Tessaracoccus sp.]|uniref:DNA-binding protein WhiA n=1 Tax=uncultured Tessaracoccus sp. TaxID=905023 RepID=UPI00263980BB|nr:DNA-binding protein WhiA [uncultured Tessaracoccus sp.]